MEYVVLFIIVIGGLALIWYFSRRSSECERPVDLEAMYKAAQHGDVFAQFTLGRTYQEGRGVAPDPDKAAQWYRMAAEQGHVEAQFALAGLLERKNSVDEAHAWYTKAAMHGHAESQKILASEKWKVAAAGADTPQAHTAPKGHATAQKAADMSPEDLDKLFQQAEAGDLDAQYNLGIMYYNGEGAPQDYQQAMNWFHLAAQQGDADAQFNLGLMIGRGEGVKKDPKISLQWFQKAAEQGHAEAKDIIAKMAKS
ncbi:MAG TPA: tetratricopeptide repeat protein [Deltaproteobacteria bacterium]|nr:tetratricopeptide repeat protein [Deltaproteobacteria bacterium]